MRFCKYLIIRKLRKLAGVVPVPCRLSAHCAKKREPHDSRSRRQVALARRILIVRTAHIVIRVLRHEVFMH